MVKLLLHVLFGGVLLVAFAGFMPPKNTDLGRLEIAFQPQLGGQPLVLEKQLYHLPNGDNLYIDVLRFYVTAVQLEGKDVLFVENNSYHLVDAEESGTQTIVLQNVPVGDYTVLRFNIGVDSLANVSGAQGGDLDPTLGMYWAWNSGYINAKLEGRSTVCKTVHHAFEFHIGGYLPPCQTVRSVTLPLGSLKISENETAFVHIQADLARFFSKIQLQTTHQVMIPSKAAAQLADYFKDIFSIYQD